jgi:hypothetical protein
MSPYNIETKSIKLKEVDKMGGNFLRAVSSLILYKTLQRDKGHP